MDELLSAVFRRILPSFYSLCFYTIRNVYDIQPLPIWYETVCKITSLENPVRPEKEEMGHINEKISLAEVISYIPF